MKYDFLESLVEKYQAKEKVALLENWTSMYDDKSAFFNYAIVRHYKPVSVVEYGAFKGRATHDILRALLDNKKPFVFKSYEVNDGDRGEAQTRLNEVFGKDAIIVGGDVVQAKDIPQEIDYLFLDHSHEEFLSKWTWDNMIPRVKKGGIIAIHDIPIRDDFTIADTSTFPETYQIMEMHNQNKLPFEKLYLLYDGYGIQSTWWTKL